jgi:hypothetical protein
MTIQFTRRDYVYDNKCSHDEYYAQFVTESVKRLVLSKWSATKIKESFAVDHNLNNLPLAQWDRLAEILSMNHDLMRKLAEANGSGGTSLSDRVCTLKRAARAIAES